jgi:proteasome lid subunit RPN8/RPN11
MTQLLLSGPLAERVIAAAIRAYPDECCGLIAGRRDAAGIRVLSVHETDNLAEEKKRGFLIDPAAQFALLRASREGDAEVIGCFHSHPNGRAEPSERDRAEAADDGFVWLIAAGNAQEGFSIRAYLFDADTRLFTPLAIAEPAALP